MTLPKRLHFSVYDASERRIDKHLVQLFCSISRSELQRSFSKILLNGKEVRASHALHVRDEVMVFFDGMEAEEIVEAAAKPQDITTLGITILHETDDFLIINKPRGMLMHPGVGHSEGTLSQLLSAHFQYFHAQQTSSYRAGIVHRLDKDTSGVLVVAKNQEAHEVIGRQFTERLVKKRYLAVVKNAPSKQRDLVCVHMQRHKVHRQKFTVTQGEGRETLTEYHLLMTNGNFSVLLFMPKTGRTHQLRVLSQHLGCPILGDRLYTRKSAQYPNVPLMLHAFSLSFYAPKDIRMWRERMRESKMSITDIVAKSNIERCTFSSPLPQDMQEFCNDLNFDLTDLDLDQYPSMDDSAQK